MTDLTPDEILDAIKRGMEDTWRRIDQTSVKEADHAPQTKRLREESDWKRSDRGRAVRTDREDFMRRAGRSG